MGQAYLAANLSKVTIPHGGLRTCKDRILPKDRVRLVTIPHGGLRTGMILRFWAGFCLKSPSHTVGSEPTQKSSKKPNPISHHPTRWAQNLRKFGLGALYSESPSHTVGSEPQITTLTKIRHINNFVKKAPLSNEVKIGRASCRERV